MASVMASSTHGVRPSRADCRSSRTQMGFGFFCQGRSRAGEGRGAFTGATPGLPWAGFTGDPLS